MEIFKVSARLRREPPVYKLVDLNDSEIDSIFYEKEIQLVAADADTEHQVEKVLRRKGNNVFVKWLGYPASFNSWIPKKNVVPL